MQLNSPDIPIDEGFGLFAIAANVCGVLPQSDWLKASVWLMIFHQFVAYALYVTPL